MADSYSSIVCTGNLLRLNPRNLSFSNQNSNIRWIYELVAPILTRALDAPASALSSDGALAFQAKELYMRQQIPITLDGFAQILDSDPTEEAVEYLSRFFSNAFVVGYELPPFLEKSLHRLGITYVNIVLGPLRFLPDLSIAFRSNDSALTERLYQFRLSSLNIDRYAGIVRARLARFGNPDTDGASAFFAGQVSDDVSLIRNGRYVDIDSLENEISAIFKKHKKILFKPHPYASRRQVEYQQRFLKRHGTVLMTTENVYRLLYATNIESVYAINSGVTREAPYFGTHSEALIPYRYPIYDDSNTAAGNFVETLNCLTSEKFWFTLFDLHQPVHEASLPTGTLRDSLGMSWGMNIGAPTKPSLLAAIRFRLSQYF